MIAYTVEPIVTFADHHAKVLGQDVFCALLLLLLLLLAGTTG
jgi:hypothetical protein